MKGINILNFIFVDRVEDYDGPMLNALCYHFEIQPGAFIFRSPKENIETMFRMAHARVHREPYPQLRGLAQEFLAEPRLEPRH